MHTPPSVRRIVRNGVAAATVSVCAAGILIGVSASAVAKPTPTLSQVQAKLKSLQTQADKLDQQYGQVKDQLAATNQRLALVNKQAAAYQARFASLRGEITRIAITAYEDGNLNSSVALLTSGKPQQILNQSSILQEISASNNAQIDQFMAAAKQVAATQQLVQRTRAGIAQLEAGLAKRKVTLDKMVSTEQALLNKLTPAQQLGAGAGGGQTGGLTYTGPTSTQGQKAVAYAYGQIGCHYQWAAAGPCSAGFDCSGLTMAAWAAAGVSIPHSSYSQESSYPHVALHTASGAFTTAYLQPGDILGFSGDSHVGIYVGGGKLIDAPHSGANVELISLGGWYMPDGAVRP